MICFLVLFFLLVILLADYLPAQTESFSVKNSTGANQLFINNNGKIGIDTSTTWGTLTINGDDGIIATGTFLSGTSLYLGAGTRFMWYPHKAALRAGYIDGIQWDDFNIGNYSFAAGINTLANGYSSISLGAGTVASGDFSTAIGSSVTCSGSYSIALGNSMTASGDHCIAIGSTTTASGSHSTAIGYSTTASGNYSTARGSNTSASGDYSTAMGYAAGTNSHTGSFIIGDHTTPFINSSLDNQFSARFANGYVLYTSSDLTTGAILGAGENSWATISDSTKKENFLPVNGEGVLAKIKSFNLKSWNYRGQNPGQFRHYGPMAQEFFNAFGKDKYGVIGNDTTINSADFDGINFIAIQALEKRTEELQEVREELAQLKDAYKKIVERMDKIENMLTNEGRAKTAVFIKN